MAWKGWASSRYTQVWSNGSYALDVYWKYRQDPVANKTQYEVQGVRVRSLKSTHSFHNASAVAGMGVMGSNRGTNTVSANVSGGGSDYFDLTNRNRTLTHNEDGTCTKEYNVHGYFDAGTGGAYNTPTGGWHWKDVHTSFPTIDRRPPTLSMYVSSTSLYSVSFAMTSNMLTTYGEYRINGGAWKGFTPPSNLQVSGGGTGTYTLSGLSPNTTYNIDFQVRRDYNQKWSNNIHLTFTTPKPSRPSRGTVSVSGVTPVSATFTASGFSFGSGAGFGYYQFANSSPDPWHSNGQSNVYRDNNLKPNTSYMAYARLVDNYGSASDAATYSFQTPKPNAPTAGTIRASSQTINSFQLTISGFAPGQYSQLREYQYRLNGGSWHTLPLSPSTHTISSLTPDTYYRIEVKAIDIYGTESSIVSTNITTLQDNIPIPSYHNLKWNLYPSYIGHNNEMLHIKDWYVYTNGRWVKNTNK